MDADFFDVLACPDDGAGPLVQRERGQGLACPQCGRRFDSPGGIPELLPRGLAEALASEQGAPRAAAVAAQASEARARDEESGVYDELHGDLEYRHELATYVRLLDARPADVVLDVGAGTGRVTKEFAGSCARVACADYSRGSLEFLLRRSDLGPARVAAVVAEASSLPFADASFDRAVALSVLCFLPDDAMRTRFVAQLARVLRPGGTLVISTYQHAWVKRLWAALGRTEGALREGWHTEGRIRYRNETRAEFVRSLAPHFAVEEIRGVCHRVPLLSNLSRRLSRGLDGLLGAIPAAAPVFATELVARCTVRPAA